MSAESFFAKWSSRNQAAKGDQAKAESVAGDAEAGSGELKPATRHAPGAPNATPATLDDVAALTRDSDYSPFVARGVSEDVKRSAMKKLFADPHYNVMDGLDIYIDDYSKFEPIPPEMLALMNHAKALLDPFAEQVDQPSRHVDTADASSGEPEQRAHRQAAAAPEISIAAHAEPAPADASEKSGASVADPTNIEPDAETAPDHTTRI